RRGPRDRRTTEVPLLEAGEFGTGWSKTPPAPETPYKRRNGHCRASTRQNENEDTKGQQEDRSSERESLERGGHRLRLRHPEQQDAKTGKR
ncbi:hypothetical protein LTR28_011950, partial [Elasticomyces elasticus]